MSWQHTNFPPNQHRDLQQKRAQKFLLSYPTVTLNEGQSHSNRYQTVVLFCSVHHHIFSILRQTKFPTITWNTSISPHIIFCICQCCSPLSTTALGCLHCYSSQFVGIRHGLFLMIINFSKWHWHLSFQIEWLHKQNKLKSLLISDLFSEKWTKQAYHAMWFVILVSWSWQLKLVWTWAYNHSRYKTFWLQSLWVKLNVNGLAMLDGQIEQSHA